MSLFVLRNGPLDTLIEVADLSIQHSFEGFIEIPTSAGTLCFLRAAIYATSRLRMSTN